MPVDLTSLAPTVGELIFVIDQEGLPWSISRDVTKVVVSTVGGFMRAGTDPYQTLAAAYMAAKEKAA